MVKTYIIFYTGVPTLPEWFVTVILAALAVGVVTTLALVSRRYLGSKF